MSTATTKISQKSYTMGNLKTGIKKNFSKKTIGG